MKSNYFFVVFIIAFFYNAEAKVFNKFSEQIDFPEIDGMTIEYNYPVFTPDDLWDYINGASDGYLAFNFIQLNIAEYSDQDGNVVKAEIYSFDRPQDAYGIYATERSPDYSFIDIGAQGYAESSLTYFVAGNYYVKVIKGSGDSVPEKKIEDIAQIICHSLVTDPELPETLLIFPADGKVAYSETFTASNVLGNEFLKDAYKADYNSDGNAFSVLIFNREQKEQCIDILKDYYAYTKEDLPDSWENGQYIVHDKYNGTINFYLRDNVLFGFLNLEDNSIQQEYTAEILKNLP